MSTYGESLQRAAELVHVPAEHLALGMVHFCALRAAQPEGEEDVDWRGVMGTLMVESAMAAHSFIDPEEEDPGEGDEEDDDQDEVRAPSEAVITAQAEQMIAESEQQLSAFDSLMDKIKRAMK